MWGVVCVCHEWDKGWGAGPAAVVPAPFPVEHAMSHDAARLRRIFALVIDSSLSVVRVRRH